MPMKCIKELWLFSAIVVLGSLSFSPLATGAESNHFLCYKTHITAGTPKFAGIKGLRLADQFEDKLFDIKNPLYLCTPADQNNEGIVDPTTHLEGYQIKMTKGEPEYIRQTHITVENQFGELVVDTLIPNELLVPTAEDLTNPVAPLDPASHGVDHFKCYDIQVSKKTPNFPHGIQAFVTDEFEQKLYDLLKPVHLCTPVDQNGKGIKNPMASLMCYTVRKIPKICTAVAPENALGACKREEDCGGRRRQTSFCLPQPRYESITGIHMNNEFGTEQADTVQEEELCVPSFIARPPDSNPCKQIDAPCESASIESVTLFSTKNNGVISTIASDGSGKIFSLDWIQTGDMVDLVFTFPGHSTLSPLQFDGKLPSLQQANVLAAVILFLNSSSSDMSTTNTLDAPRSLLESESLFASKEEGDHPANNAGCDEINNWPLFGSCGPKGACCDLHDLCIFNNCRGPNNSGNVKECLASFPICSLACMMCHYDVIACYLHSFPGESQCCKNSPPDCGKPQCCVIDGSVITNPKMCSEITNTCNGDPTFIQLSPQAIVQAFRSKTNSTANGLIAKIAVPYDGALVRANVPIIGLAYGEAFKEYRVEYGEGADPRNWTLITMSAEPQINAPTLKDLTNSSPDMTVHGNLATWDTGLKSYVYLPYYPPDHAMDLNGKYTLRLVAMGKNGEVAEDRVTVDVGEAIPNAWGGVVRSRDNRVTLTIPEQSLMDSFRLISIKPAENAPVVSSPERKVIGEIYEFREDGEKFPKGSILEMQLPQKELSSMNPDKVGIYAYDPQKKVWKYLESSRRQGVNAFYAKVKELRPYYTLMASDKSVEWSTSEKPVADYKSAQASSLLGTNEHYLVRDTFEESMGGWSNRDGEVGAILSLDDTATYDGTRCLKITNTNGGGNFAVNILETPFDVRRQPLVQFDYRIPPNVKTNFLIKALGRWYEIGFTGDYKELRDKRVNITHIGDIKGVITDDEWHTARFNLYDMLRTKTGNFIVEEMIMADWEVDGYMKLHFGHNKKGATYYIDNFTIRREDLRGVSILSDKVLLDDFNQKKTTNAIGGDTAIFTDSVGGSLKAVFSSEDAAGKGHSLELSYDVSKVGSYAGYVSHLQNLDLRAYQALTFFIKGKETGQDLIVGLKDSSGRESKVPVSRYLRGKISTAGHKVEIPLVAFPDIIDWGSLENLTFSFSNQFHNQGVVFVDNVEFRKDLRFIMVDDFERDDERNTLGRSHRTFVSGAAAITGKYTKASSNGIYRLSYGGSIGVVNAYASDLKSYAGWTTSLGGIDCSQCKILSFRIRGGDGGENPSIYLDDGNFRWGVNIEKYTKVTTSWQEVTLPLYEFADYGVDLTHLEDLQFVFEGEKMSGTIYLDDIQFGSPKVL
jgi:hypothetical protein